MKEHIRPELIFVSMPLLPDEKHTIRAHINHAKKVVWWVLGLGAYPVCPVTNSGFVLQGCIKSLTPGVTLVNSEESVVMPAIRKLVVLCDAVYFPVWEPPMSDEDVIGQWMHTKDPRATRCWQEVNYAISIQKPVFYHKEGLCNWLASSDVIGQWMHTMEVSPKGGKHEA